MMDKPTLKEFIDWYHSFWFENDYFSQTGYYSVDAEDIRDDSLLALSCGNWQYEWTFSIPQQG